MIEQFSAENCGCLRAVDVKLTKLHAFVGPNDSGKSTLLRAVRNLVALASRRSNMGDTTNGWDSQLFLSRPGADPLMRATLSRAHGSSLLPAGSSLGEEHPLLSGASSRRRQRMPAA